MSRDSHDVETTMRDWSRGIGEKYGQRDRDAAFRARTLVDLERERHTAYLLRNWMEQL